MKDKAKIFYLAERLAAVGRSLEVDHDAVLWTALEVLERAVLRFEQIAAKRARKHRRWKLAAEARHQERQTALEARFEVDRLAVLEARRAGQPWTLK